MKIDRIHMPALEQELTALRREFHKYPEAGWTEFHTTAKIISEMEELGLAVEYGPAIHVKEKMFGLPAPEVLDACWRRAMEETDRPDLVEVMRGGFTGCVVCIEGALPGPVTGVRVDIDCNEVQESDAPEHIPAAEGFRSVHPGCMHACGHDAHAAIGVGLAKVLCAYRDRLQGTVVLAFQPGEEGLRGAASLTAAGHFARCDVLYGIHVGLMNAPVGTVAAGIRGYLASTKFDVLFHGVAAHAGLAPEQGRNAVAAAAKATLDLLDIPPHPEGVSRVNVGTFHGGSGRNVIPAEAVLTVETRGAATAINTYMEETAKRFCQEAAEKYGCTCEVRFMGAAGSGACDAVLAEQVRKILPAVEGVQEVLPAVTLSIGEDFTIMMEEVQSHGGLATQLVLGMPLKAAHHNGCFDVDERVIGLGVRCLAALSLETKEKT